MPAGKSISSKLFDESSANELDLEGVPSTSTPKTNRLRPRRKQNSESESKRSSGYSLHDDSQSDDGSHFSISEAEYFEKDDI